MLLYRKDHPCQVPPNDLELTNWDQLWWTYHLIRHMFQKNQTKRGQSPVMHLKDSLYWDMQIKSLFGKIQCKLYQQLPQAHDIPEYSMHKLVSFSLISHLLLSIAGRKHLQGKLAQSSRYSSRSHHVVKTHEHPYSTRNQHLISKRSQDQQLQEGTNHWRCQWF